MFGSSRRILGCVGGFSFRVISWFFYFWFLYCLVSKVELFIGLSILNVVFRTGLFSVS